VKEFRDVKAVLSDIDGTLHFRKIAIPGANDALRKLRDAGLVCRFLTNTDSVTAETLAAELREMGLDVAAEEIFTPVLAAVEFLKSQPGKTCLPIVSPELRPYFAPFEHVDQPNYVILGDVREILDYPLINDAFQKLMAGAELVAFQTSRYYMRANGYNLDTGGFARLLEYASGQTARVLGKPTLDFFHLVLRQLDLSPQDVVVVGDDVTTDIEGSLNLGARSVLVQTGKYEAQPKVAPSGLPDVVVPTFATLPALVGAA